MKCSFFSSKSLINVIISSIVRNTVKVALETLELFSNRPFICCSESSRFRSKPWSWEQNSSRVCVHWASVEEKMLRCRNKLNSSSDASTTVSTNKNSSNRLVWVLRWVKIPAMFGWNLLESSAPHCLAPLHPSVVCEEFLPEFSLSLTVCSVDYTAPLYHFSSVSYDFPSE